MSCPPSTSEKFEFAKGKLSFGQKGRGIVREVLGSLLSFAEESFRAGKSSRDVLEAVMPV